MYDMFNLYKDKFIGNANKRKTFRSFEFNERSKREHELIATMKKHNNKQLKTNN